MKIAQVVHGFPPHNFAGTEIYTHNLCKELARRHKVFVFHRIKDAQRKEYALSRKREDGFKIYALNNTFRSCSSFEQTYKNEAITKSFVEFLEQTQPDLVHIQHLLFLSTTIIEEIKKRNLPIVFTLHDYYLFCPRGQLLNKDLNICDKPNISACAECLISYLYIGRKALKLYGFFYKRAPYILLQIFKNIYLKTMAKVLSSKKENAGQITERFKHFKNLCEAVNIFVAPSTFLKNKFIEFGIPESKIVCLRNGINSSVFKNISKINSLDKLKFAFIGTLLPNKGVHLLINAFNKIEKANVELRIYGKIATYKGFERYLKDIKRLAKNKNIQFMGEYANEEIAKIFTEIDVLVVPSIWQENSPLVIQEALLAKTPVIAADIGGIPELIRDGENSLLFKRNDVDGLYRKMDLLINNRMLLEKLSRAKNSIKSIEENAREMEKIYLTLVNGKYN